MITAMESNIDWGRALKVVRAARSAKQADVAEAAGVDKSYLSLIENNKKSPSLGVLGGLCEVLDLPISDLARIAEGPAKALGIPATAGEGS